MSPRELRLVSEIGMFRQQPHSFRIADHPTTALVPGQKGCLPHKDLLSDREQNSTP